MPRELFDITAQLHYETEKAVLVSIDGERDNAVWLPKAMIELEKKKGEIVEITAPETLLRKKGLI